MPLTATPIGSYVGGVYPFTITTTADCPAGSSNILMFGGSGPPNPATTVTDSAGNTYVVGATDNTGWISAGLSGGIVHLPVGGTITVGIPPGGSSGHAWCQAFNVNAFMTQDVSGTGNSNGTPVTTPTLAGAPEFVVGMSWVYPGGGGSITAPAGWTTALHSTVSGTGSLLAEVDYLIAATTAPVTYAPAMSNFHAASYLNVFTFIALLSPPPGLLAITGYVPTLSSSNLAITPPTGLLAITGYAPRLPASAKRRQASVRFI